MVFLTLILVQ